jgi:pilus assembly protein CpaE
MMSTRQGLHIAGVVRSPQLQYELTETIASCDGLSLDLRVGELKSLGFDLVRGAANPGLLLLDVDVDDGADMDVLGRLSSHARDAGIPVVATAGDLGPAGIRRLLRRGVSDFIAQPIDRAEVLDALQIADQGAPRQYVAGPPRGRIFTFSRATGGAGATTLAVNLAYALARPHRGTQPKVCLIDLDLHFGTVALQLDLRPGVSLLDIARAPERLGPALFTASLVEHRSGLRVLTAPGALMWRESLRPATVETLLELARGEFDYVILDLPVALTPWTETVLRHSDLVYLVTQLNVPAVHQLRRLLDAIEEFGLQDLAAQLVLNRVQGSLWGTGVRRRQAEKALGRKFDYHIADQFDVLIDAANRGTPALDVRRFSRFARQLRAMLRRSLRELGVSATAAPAG